MLMAVMCLEEVGHLTFQQVRAKLIGHIIVLFGSLLVIFTPSASRYTSGDPCNRDPATPLPNARKVSIEFHPDISNEDNSVSEKLERII